MSLADLSPLANHLWQSTLFLVVVWLLAVALRRSQAQVRHWLWLAASVKFLVPFAVLMALGGYFSWQSATTIIVQPDMTFVIDAVSQPFSRPEVAAISRPTAPAGEGVLSILILVIWFGGCAIHLLAWWGRWRCVAATVQAASPLEGGRELDALRRLETTVGIRQPIAVVMSDTSLEPGVFGIFKPVLVWPRSIGERLADRQLEAILTHELCHVRRRDNLTMTLHMVVETAVWFHPLVWWLEKRLVDERERACDEEVVRLGYEPQVYAESIIKTCEFYMESPVIVAGVTGSNLKKRVEAIMRGHAGQELKSWKKTALATAGVLTVAAPLMIGLRSAPPLRAQSSTTVDAVGPAFDVVSIKPNKSGDPGLGGLGFQPSGRFSATRVSARELIRVAYTQRPFEQPQLSDGPSWLDSERFDIEAKAEGLPPIPEVFIGQMRLMLRSLLHERFRLAVHTETRELPIYALVIARGDGKTGQQLRHSEIDCAALRKQSQNGAPSPKPEPGKGPPCSVGPRPGHLTANAVTMPEFANVLSPFADRVVIDRTGLRGGFDLLLTWTPSPGEYRGPGGDEPDSDRSTTDGPSIFTALQEQLGLKLESTRGPVDVLVINSVQRPSSDEVGLTTDQPPSSATQSSATSADNPFFEVASVKTNKSGQLRTTIQGMQPGGRFMATNMTLRTLIRTAFRIQDFQLLGPKWIDSERFDIVAKADRVYTSVQLPRMMQTLLAERFKLAVHTESRDLRLYALVLATSDGQLGPRIRPSIVDCGALLASGAPPPPFEPGKAPPCTTNMSRGHLIASGMTLAALASTLSIQASGVVVDRTRRSGAFDLELEWTPDSPAPAPADGTAFSDRPADSGPSIFTAVQEQLGLKLDPQRGPVTVTIVDRVEQPTAD